MCTNPSEKYCKYCGNTIVFAVFQFFSVFGNSCFLLVLSFLPFFFVLALSFKFCKFRSLFCCINLLLKFDGNSVEEIEEAYAKVAKLCLKQGALDVLISDTEEREESIWKARGAFLEAIKGSTTYMDEVDMVVPRNCVNDMVVYLHNLQKEMDIRIKSFGHAGDGNLHAYILKDDLSDEEWEKRMKDTMEKIYQKAHELRGQVSGEHGIGFAKKPYLRESLPTENLELMNGIKRVFNPKNILNPHKVAQL